MHEYAQCPTPVVLDANTLRVYIACRPERGSDLQYVAYPGYVDLARNDIKRIQGASPKPIMPLGNTGTFDEFGIMPSSFVRNGDEMYAYYSGWTRMQSAPYTLAIGLAISKDGGTTFEKLGEGPVLGISLDDPYFVTGPIVRIVEGTWLMWYLSCKKWMELDGKSEPIYRMALAKSSDGISWSKHGDTVIPPLSANECQDICAPFFYKEKWHAIFAWRDPTFRNGRYQLGYAQSDDLSHWTRDDSLVGLELSASGWDSEMMCYPQVIELDGRLLIFYCGNNFGRDGFGAAELLD